jgi:hypothetical protein
MEIEVTSPHLRLKCVESRLQTSPKVIEKNGYIYLYFNPVYVEMLSNSSYFVF